MCVQLCVHYVCSRRHKHIDLTRWMRYVKRKWFMWCISKWHILPSSTSLVKQAKHKDNFIHLLNISYRNLFCLSNYWCIHVYRKYLVIWNGRKIDTVLSPCLFRSYTQWNPKCEYSKFIVYDCKMLPFWIPCNLNHWERLISNPVFLQYNID